LASSAIIPGAFYLTDDTNRLYIGKQKSQNENVIEALSDSIIRVASISDLANIKPTFADYTEDGMGISSFYYATAENVLCVYVAQTEGSGGHWIQINPDTDTYIDGSKIEVKVLESNDSATFTTTLTQTTNNANGSNYDEPNGDEDLTAAWTVQTDSGLKVEDVTTNAAIPTIKISNMQRLSVSGNPKNEETQTSVDISLVDKSGTALTTVTFKGDAKDGIIDNSNYITVFKDPDNNIINISGKNLHDEDISDIQHNNTDGTITTTLKRHGNEAGSISASFTPILKYGVDYATEAKFNTGIINGTNDTTANAQLSVYTIDEVDSLINSKLADVDALKYVGVINEDTIKGAKTVSGEIFEPETLRNGHTYKVTQDQLITTTGRYFRTTDEFKSYNKTADPKEIYALPGDLLIASGTEGKNSDGEVTSFTLDHWDYVPSGDD
jgi:hypothetical protein